MKINTLLFVFILSSSVFTQIAQYRLNPEQNRKLRQAKSLNNNGLIDQAQQVYYELFKESPYLKEAFNPLKDILRKNENWELLTEISIIYLKYNQNSIEAKMGVLEIMIWK